MKLAALVLVLSSLALAAEKAPGGAAEPVTIETPDGWRLDGFYAASTAPRRADAPNPAVVLVHMLIGKHKGFEEEVLKSLNAICEPPRKAPAKDKGPDALERAL